MNVVIVGGGKVGSYLASLLLEGEHDVHIVENRPHVLARLHRELPTEVIVDGDGTRRETLDLAHADRADVLVTATGDDEVNLTIALMAKTFYKIPRVIGRINNPRNAWLFTPEMGVDVAVNQTDLLSKLILEEMFETGKLPQVIVEEKGLVQISDKEALAQIVEQVIAENPQAVEDFKGGKGRAIGFLVGQVMRLTKGKANPQIVTELLKKKLSTSSE